MFVQWRIVVPGPPAWAEPGNHEHRPLPNFHRPVSMGSGLAGETRAPERPPTAEASRQRSKEGSSRQAGREPGSLPLIARSYWQKQAGGAQRGGF